MVVRMTRWLFPMLLLALGLSVSCTRSETPKSESTLRPTGEWTSTIRVAERPEVTVTFAPASTGSGSMSLLGERRGSQEWTTMPLAKTAWNGTEMTFETDLPDGEGTVRWTFRPVTRNRARLTALLENTGMADEPILWSLEQP